MPWWLFVHAGHIVSESGVCGIVPRSGAEPRTLVLWYRAVDSSRAAGREKEGALVTVKTPSLEL